MSFDEEEVILTKMQFQYFEDLIKFKQTVREAIQKELRCSCDIHKNLVLKECQICRFKKLLGLDDEVRK